VSGKPVLAVLIILASGFITTLVSGVYAQDLTRGVGASVTGFGFPLSWYKKTIITYPSNPTQHSFVLEFFVLDIVFWSLIMDFPVAVLIRWFKTRKKQE
jgi:hypothetical protein